MLPASDAREAKYKTRMALITVVAALLAGPVHATVLEYDGAGKVTITEIKEQTAPPAVPTPADTTALRNLTRDVAIRYSGAMGVRKASLDALTFVEIFEALVERESAFDPTAVSAKGAKGLGQLMPGTASDMDVADPFDPESNLIGSAKYFTLLLAEFGSLELALAAYNAGPERVRKYKGVPPFAETKAYIDWISKTAGLGIEAPKPVNASARQSEPVNKEQPLNGDVSVWEF